MEGTTKPAHPENYRREIAFIFFKRLPLILLTGFLVCAAAVVVVLYWPPTYGAHGSVLLKGRKVDRDPGQLEAAELRAFPVTDADLYSELSIITSDELFGRTIENLENRGRTDVLAALSEEPSKRVAALRDSLSAHIVPTSNVIEVTLEGKDPAATREILQTLFDTYVVFRQTIYNPNGVSDFLTAQVQRLREQLADKNDQIATFLAQTGLTSGDRQIEANLALKQDLEARLVDLETTISNLRQEIRYFEELLASPDVQVFASVHLDDGTELSGRAEIAAYLRQLRGRLGVAEGNRERFTERIAALEAENQALRRNQLTYLTMEQEAQVLQRSYQTLLTRHTEAQIDNRINGQTLNPYISILVPPRLMEDPLWPKSRVVLPAGFLAAILLAVSLAFLKEYLDHTFTRPEEVQRVLGVPNLFNIPEGAVRKQRIGPKPAKTKPAGATAVAKKAVPAAGGLPPKGPAAATAGGPSPVSASLARPRRLWLRRAFQLAVVAGVLGAAGWAMDGMAPEVLNSIIDFRATLPELPNEASAILHPATPEGE